MKDGKIDNKNKMSRTKFCSLYPRRLHIKFSFDWPSGFGEEDL